MFTEENGDRRHPILKGEITRFKYSLNVISSCLYASVAVVQSGDVLKVIGAPDTLMVCKTESTFE